MAVLVREPQAGCLCDLGSAVGGFLEVPQDAMKVSLVRSVGNCPKAGYP